MKFKLYYLISILLCLPSISLADTSKDKQHDSLAKMGALNGLALHCRYKNQVSNIKTIVINTIPPLRELGAIFEKSTSESFSKAMLDQQKCPEIAFFKQQISLGQIRLESAYSQ